MEIEITRATPHVVVSESGKPIGYCSSERNAKNYIRSYGAHGCDVSRWTVREAKPSDLVHFFPFAPDNLSL